MAGDAPKRRVFLREGDRSFQILSFAQETDGSIYVMCPNFAKSKWLDLSAIITTGAAVKAETAPGDGKLSVHATGFAGVRAHTELHGHRFVVNGSPLVDPAKNTISVRHLVTALIAQPSHTPAGVRRSDYVLETPHIKPIAFVFFAVPRTTGLKGVKVQCQFHVDVIGEPPDVSWGDIPLPLHSLVWLAYSTKQMTGWPADYHFCHHDGHDVPLFMGGGPQAWHFCAVRPRYAIEANELLIELNASPFDGSPPRRSLSN
jgi:hypothetical protein